MIYRPPLNSEPWTVIHGEALAALLDLPGACAAAVITDPPYSSGGFTRGDRMAATSNKYVMTALTQRPEFAGDNRDQRGYLVWCTLWLDQALRVTMPGGSLLMFTDWRQLPTTIDAVQAGGWVWRGIVHRARRLQHRRRRTHRRRHRLLPQVRHGMSATVARPIDVSDLDFDALTEFESTPTLGSALKPGMLLVDPDLGTPVYFHAAPPWAQ